MWRFYATTEVLSVKSEPVDPAKFTGWDATCSYVVLHAYRRKDEAPNSPPYVPSHGPMKPTGSQRSCEELNEESERCLSPRGLNGPFSGYDDCGPYPFETATLSDGKGGSVDERGPIAHDLYIWNGKNTLALTKAVALTKCFELERMLINDEIGTIHHIHRGMGRSEGVNLPLSPLFAADYDLSRDEVFGSPPDDRPGDNHLLSQLCRNVECETIPCSSLILCMLPGLSTRETTAFPMLHKALSAHVKPNPPDAPSPLRPGNLPGKAPAGYPFPHQPSPGSSVAGRSNPSPQPSPNLSRYYTRTTPERPSESGAGITAQPPPGIPKIPSLSGLSSSAADALASEPSPAPNPPPVMSQPYIPKVAGISRHPPVETDITKLMPDLPELPKIEPMQMDPPPEPLTLSNMPPMPPLSARSAAPAAEPAKPRPARPGSAGTNGPRVPAMGMPGGGMGLNLSKLNAPPPVERDLSEEDAEDTSTPPEPPRAPPAIPRLGAKGPGLPKGMGLDLSGLASAYESGSIEPNELTNKAEKLRYFNVRCSQITDDLFLGADTVARDLKLLKENGITHVLNTAGVACKNYHEGEFVYKTLHLHDTPREDISPVMYSAVEFIDDAIEKGGKVYVHCHQGVSRSSSMTIAYLMWKRDLTFDQAFQHVKERRGVVSPNAGFICRLLAFHKDIHPTGPPEPARLFRLTPFVGGPVARAVEVTPLSFDLLETRMIAVLYGPLGLYIWSGEKAHPEYLDGAKSWAAQLVKFEAAPNPIEITQGSEPSAFWEMLNGEGPVPSRKPEYDKDYGVGTQPTIPPPEIEVSMPSTISAPMSIAGDGTRALIPGIHTTAEDDDDDDDDEVDTSQPLPTARGPAPPRGLGLGSLPPRMAAQEEEQEEPPVRRGFADIPRVEDPMPTPRGGRPGGLPECPLCDH